MKVSNYKTQALSSSSSSFITIHQPQPAIIVFWDRRFGYNAMPKARLKTDS